MFTCFMVIAIENIYFLTSGSGNLVNSVFLYLEFKRKEILLLSIVKEQVRRNKASVYVLNGEEERINTYVKNVQKLIIPGPPQKYMINSSVVAI